MVFLLDKVDLTHLDYVLLDIHTKCTIVTTIFYNLKISIGTSLISDFCTLKFFFKFPCYDDSNRNKTFKFKHFLKSPFFQVEKFWKGELRRRRDGKVEEKTKNKQEIKGFEQNCLKLEDIIHNVLVSIGISSFLSQN